MSGCLVAFHLFDVAPHNNIIVGCMDIFVSNDGGWSKNV